MTIVGYPKSSSQSALGALGTGLSQGVLNLATRKLGELHRDKEAERHSEDFRKYGYGSKTAGLLGGLAAENPDALQKYISMIGRPASYQQEGQPGLLGGQQQNPESTSPWNGGGANSQLAQQRQDLNVEKFNAGQNEKAEKQRIQMSKHIETLRPKLNAFKSLNDTLAEALKLAKDPKNNGVFGAAQRAKYAPGTLLNDTQARFDQLSNKFVTDTVGALGGRVTNARLEALQKSKFSLDKRQEANIKAIEAAMKEVGHEEKEFYKSHHSILDKLNSEIQNESTNGASGQQQGQEADIEAGQQTDLPDGTPASDGVTQLIVKNGRWEIA